MTERQEAIPPTIRPSFAGRVAAWICVLACAFYLLNPGFGVVELILDNVPVVGNLDEVGAMLLLFGALEYLGIRLPGFLSRFAGRR